MSWISFQQCHSTLLAFILLRHSSSSQHGSRAAAPLHRAFGVVDGAHRAHTCVDGRVPARPRGSMGPGQTASPARSADAAIRSDSHVHALKGFPETAAPQATSWPESFQETCLPRLVVESSIGVGCRWGGKCTEQSKQRGQS